MIPILILAALAVLLDQISKILVVAYLSHEIVIIPGFFKFEYVLNTGVAWGIAVDKWILVVVTIVALGVLGYLAYKTKFKENKWFGVTISFIIGGTIGNFIDRMFRPNGVVDFLAVDLYYPSFKDGFKFDVYHFPVFNIADSFIVIGSIMLIIYILFLEDKKNNSKTKSNDNN